MSRLEEGVEIMQRLFTGEHVDYDGKHYQLTGHPGRPLPLQQPLPLLIGGGGPRMIRLAARAAEIIGFVPRSLPGGGPDPDEFADVSKDAKIALLDEAVADAGRTDGGPERSVLIFGRYVSLDAVAEGGSGAPVDAARHGRNVAVHPRRRCGRRR
jgi:alkanesulfonate monooxygenase SsuD/methylene tetrahydromethanopterin reductase-like flavin-dependent oxidoreductase (luciferase family)